MPCQRILICRLRRPSGSLCHHRADLRLFWHLPHRSRAEEYRPKQEVQVLQGRHLCPRRCTWVIASLNHHSPLSGFYIGEERYIADNRMLCITQIPGEYRINCISVVNSLVTMIAPTFLLHFSYHADAGCNHLPRQLQQGPCERWENPPLVSLLVLL